MPQPCPPADRADQQERRAQQSQPGRAGASTSDVGFFDFDMALALTPTLTRRTTSIAVRIDGDRSGGHQHWPVHRVRRQLAPWTPAPVQDDISAYWFRTREAAT